MRVFSNSIPKGGTHLILKLVTLLNYPEAPNRLWLGAALVRSWPSTLRKIMKGSYSSRTVVIGSESPVIIGSNWLESRLNKIPAGCSFGGHCIYSEELARIMKKTDTKVVCILRDPRAIAYSHLQYMKTYKNHFYYKEYMSLPSDSDRLLLTINGGLLGKHKIESINNRYKAFLNWKNDESALMVKFEDLVGPKGGGTQSRQMDAIVRVAEHIDVSADGHALQTVANNLHGNSTGLTKSSSFRMGRVDSWMTELDSKTIRLIEKNTENILTDMGY